MNNMAIMMKIMIMMKMIMMKTDNENNNDDEYGLYGLYGLYEKKSVGGPIVANAPGAAARLDTPRHVFYRTILFMITIFKNLKMFPKLCFSFISI